MSVSFFLCGTNDVLMPETRPFNGGRLVVSIFCLKKKPNARSFFGTLSSPPLQLSACKFVSEIVDVPARRDENESDGENLLFGQWRQLSSFAFFVCFVSGGIQVGRDADSLRLGQLLRDSGTDLAASGRWPKITRCFPASPANCLLFMEPSTRQFGRIHSAVRLLRYEVSSLRSQLFQLFDLPTTADRSLQYGLLRSSPFNEWYVSLVVLVDLVHLRRKNQKNNNKNTGARSYPFVSTTKLVFMTIPHPVYEQKHWGSFMRANWWTLKRREGLPAPMASSVWGWLIDPIS